MLSDRCPVCLSVCPVLFFPSVTLVCCGQTVGWIKMKLGMQVGLGPDHIVLDGDPASPQKDTQQPPLLKFTGVGFACVRIIRGPCLLWSKGWIDQNAIWYEGRSRPGHIVLNWDPVPQKRGSQQPPFFGRCYCGKNGLMDQGETWHGGRPQHRRHCVRWGPSSPHPQRGTASQFSSHVCCGQTAGWIKMPLGRELGLGPGHMALDSDPAPQRGTAPLQYSVHVYCGQTVAHLNYC